MTSTNRNGIVETYTYDHGGNLLTFNNGVGISHTLVYDDRYNGNMGWGDLLRTVDEQTITYDYIGNPTRYYNGYWFDMTWEQGRQLASVTYDGKTTSYQYNSDGIRTKKTNNNGSYVVYHLAGGKPIGETHFAANNDVQYYLRYNFDETGSVVGVSYWGANGHWDDYYFVKNLQGDVLKVYLASNDAEVASYTYDSWGNILTSSGSFANINPFRYRTYYYDNETWFYYLQSRYYDPSIGRFINADAQISGVGGEILGYNMFAYCNNNPVNMVDYSGEEGNGIELGQGWYYRIDPQKTSTGTKRHIHIWNKNKKYIQNDDGSPHDKRKGKGGKIPKWLNDTLIKKANWDYNGNRSSFFEQTEFTQFVEGSQYTFADGTIAFQPYNPYLPQLLSVNSYESAYFKSDITYSGTSSTTQPFYLPIVKPIPLPSFSFSFNLLPAPVPLLF